MENFKKLILHRLLTKLFNAMKLTIYCFAALLFSILIITQADAQSAYSMHTLATGETLSMLSKSYHTTVGDIMRMNGMNTKSQLHVGDKIKIPAGGTVVAEKTLTATVSAPSQSLNTTAKTHVVEKGETLYRLSKMYHISVDKLIKLNNLSVPTTHVGQTLIISEGAAPQAAAKNNKEQSIVAPKEAPAQTTQKDTTKYIVVETTDTKRKSIAPEPVTQKSSAQPAVTTPQTDVATTVDNNASPANNNVYTPPVNASKEGFFTSLYGKDTNGKQEQTKSGSSMTFKSASGWADKKYYILMNDAPTGSIVKIKNGKNELFAKVLWSLGAMKENDGLNFRISTAAAAALGITDQKFDLKVDYYE